jgi:hypothetical protein
MKPGVELACFLASIDVARVSGYDRIVVLRAHHKMRSFYDAQLYRDIASVVDAVDDSDVFGTVEDDAAAEIRAALRWPAAPPTPKSSSPYSSVTGSLESGKPCWRGESIPGGPR